MLHSELEEIIRSCAAGNMACSWRVYDEFTSGDNRLRVSLVTPVEEPWNDFLDIRRVFEKNGEVLPTKRGMRIPISVDQLTDLVETLQSIGHGRKKLSETAGLRLVRQSSVLYVRRVSTPSREEKGDPPVLLVLNPVEVVFLHDKLIVLKDIMIAHAREDEVMVINEKEENVAWF